MHVATTCIPQYLGYVYFKCSDYSKKGLVRKEKKTVCLENLELWKISVEEISFIF